MTRKSIHFTVFGFLALLISLSPTSMAQLFSPPVSYQSGGNEPGFVAIADVNGDGKQDLLVANTYFSNTIGVLLGNGDGTFQPAQVYPTGGGYPVTIVPIDVNGDRHLDLVVANQSQCYTCLTEGVVSILLGRGDGTFAPAATYDSGGIGFGNNGIGPAELTVQDVNGDGKPDIVVVNCASTIAGNCGTGDGVVSVLLGNGNGTFQPAINSDAGVPKVGVGLAVADVNGDGRPDAIIGVGNCTLKCSTGSVGIMLGIGNGTFQPAVLYPLKGASPNGIQAADLNGDGNVDVVVGTCNTTDCLVNDGTVKVLLGNGDGTFRSAVAYDTGGPLPDGVTIGDINGDGKPDVVTTNVAIHSSATDNSVVAVFLGNGDGTLQKVINFSSGGYLTYSSALADLNGDGRNDLVVGSNGGGGIDNIDVLLNNSQSLLPTTLTLTSSPNPVVVNRPINLRAAVNSASGPPPDGQVVTFSVGGKLVGSSKLKSGLAVLNSTITSVGTDKIAANYPGNGSLAPSAAVVTEVIFPPPVQSTTVISSSLNPSTYGQRFTLTARVTSANSQLPTGQVVFRWGSSTIGTATLNSAGVAVLTTPVLNADVYATVAAYLGDIGHVASTSGVLDQVVQQTTSSAILTSSANPAKDGQAVTFTAKISSPTVTATGPVTIKAGNAVLGTVQLSNGRATLTTAALPPGSTKISVTYLGDSNIQGSSASLTEVVAP